MSSIGELVFSGPLLLALPIALAAGFVAFASPCVLPLVPGYLGYVSGFTGSTTTKRPTTRSGGGGVAVHSGVLHRVH